MNKFYEWILAYKLQVVFALILVLVGACSWVVAKKQPTYGLDINGGIRAVLQAEVEPGKPYDQDTVRRVLENRLNATGVAEPSIANKGDRQFVIELPNMRNKDQIVQQLQSTAQLEILWFRDVKGQRDPGAQYSYSIDKDQRGRDQYIFTDSATHRTFHDQSKILEDFQTEIVNNSQARAGATVATLPTPLAPFAPEDQILYLDQTQTAQAQKLNAELQDWLAFRDKELSATDGNPVVTGDDLKQNGSAASATYGQTNGGLPGPVVNLSFGDTGAQKFGNFTQNHINDLTGIILDGRVLSVVRIDDAILDGNCEISGGFANLTDAQTLANFLNAGSLPVKRLTIQQVDSVDATLGKSAVDRMKIAGLIGLGLVLIFMAVYYLLPGLVADIALIFYALFTLAIFEGALSWFVPTITLTLPGIAGFILSVGMAVDANILIFERLKEELRNGKPLKQAIDSGFRRAFTAIRDSNICTLITCVILATMGTESVKGFAITLGVGVLVSLFTAITATRTMLYLLVNTKFGNNPALFGLGRQWVTGSHAAETGPGTHGQPYYADGAKQPLNVIRNRKIYYAISLLIIIPGVIFWSMGGLKRSIEFKGGTQVEVVFQTPQVQDAVRKAIIDAGYKDNEVQMATGPHGESIAYVSIVDRSPTAYQEVEGALDKAGFKYQLQSHSQVGGIISAELTRNAFQAVLIAAALIVLYMAFAFSIGGFVAGLRFGMSAIIALLHDVLVLIGSFAILGHFLDWQIDSLFVTATLTVVGFSVHDTIVIFDRLRENLRRKLKGDSFEDLANRSILQSFARSINTSLTVVMTLLALLLFGEPSTRHLIVALLIGIVSGTYSSIFNATPILVDWENWIARMRGQAYATVSSVAAGIGPEAELPTPGATGNGNSSASPTPEITPASSSKIVKSTDGGIPVAPGRPAVARTKKKTGGTRRF